MNINSNFIVNNGIMPNAMLNISTGKLKEYTLKVLNVVSKSLQNEKIAIPVAIAANLLFFEVAARLSDYVVELFLNIYNKDGSVIFLNRAKVYFGLNAVTISLLNLSFYRCVASSLTPLCYVAITAQAIALRTAFASFSR